MNCPHHHRIFAAEPRSYRDLPLRLAEYGTCYRYEQSGELFGLMRVRSLNMNDAHIYCTEEQFAAEFNAVNEMYLKYFKIFGIEKYVMRFSTHDAGKARARNTSTSPSCGSKTEDMVRRRPASNPASTTSRCRTKRRSTARRLTCRSGASSAANSPWPPTRWTSPCPRKFGLIYRDKDNTEQDAAVHPSRAARHARAVHRLPHRALRRQLPALARARAGARPHHRRRRAADRTTPRPSSAELRANMVRAEARFQQRPDQGEDRRTPNKRTSTPCWSSAVATWKPARSASASTAKAPRREAEGRSRGGYSGGDQRAAGVKQRSKCSMTKTPRSKTPPAVGAAVELAPIAQRPSLDIASSDLSWQPPRRVIQPRDCLSARRRRFLFPPHRRGL